MNTKGKVKKVEVIARIKRADGTVEELGVISSSSSFDGRFKRLFRWLTQFL